MTCRSAARWCSCTRACRAASSSPRARDIASITACRDAPRPRCVPTASRSRCSRPTRVGRQCLLVARPPARRAIARRMKRRREAPARSHQKRRREAPARCHQTSAGCSTWPLLRKLAPAPEGQVPVMLAAHADRLRRGVPGDGARVPRQAPADRRGARGARERTHRRDRAPHPRGRAHARAARARA